jgi:hypothetical protein
MDNIVEEAIDQSSANTYGDTERLKFVKEMQAQGFVVLEPDEEELLIDCDTEEHFKMFLEQLTILERNLGLEIPYKDWESRGGPPGKHISVLMPFQLSPQERIAWQAALGSDPKRELLSLIRLRNGDALPTILVEKPNFKGGEWI